MNILSTESEMGIPATHNEPAADEYPYPATTIRQHYLGLLSDAEPRVINNFLIKLEVYVCTVNSSVFNNFPGIDTIENYCTLVSTVDDIRRDGGKNVLNCDLNTLPEDVFIPNLYVSYEMCLNTDETLKFYAKKNLTEINIFGLPKEIGDHFCESLLRMQIINFCMNLTHSCETNISCK
jgi:hypothetical protein